MQPNDEIKPTETSNTDLDLPPNADAEAPVAPTTVSPNSVQPAQTSQPPIAEPAVAVALPANQGRRKKFVLVAAILGLVLLIGGGGAAAYYGYVLPNRPERIAGQALANTINQEKVQSAAFEGEVSFEGGEASQVVSGVSFNGVTSNTGAMQANITVNTLVSKISLEARTEDGKTTYLKLSGLNGLDSLLATFAGGAESPEQTQAVASLISSINDQWFMIDQSFISQLGGETAALTESKLSTEDAQKVTDIYKQHQFLTINQRLEDQEIHGVKSFHLKATINKDQLVAFLNEIKAANIASLPVEQSLIDEASKIDFSKYPFEMWVGKKDRLITQLAATFQAEDTKYKVRIAFFDYNKPVTVQKPDNAKSILELLGDIAPLAGSFSDSTETEQATDLPLLLQ